MPDKGDLFEIDEAGVGGVALSILLHERQVLHHHGCLKKSMKGKQREGEGREGRERGEGGERGEGEGRGRGEGRGEGGGERGG